MSCEETDTQGKCQMMIEAENIKNWQLPPASQMGQLVKNLPVMQETQVWFLGWEDSMEKGMAILSSILVWRIPWIKEPGGLQSRGSQRVWLNWVTNTSTFTGTWSDVLLHTHTYTHMYEHTCTQMHTAWISRPQARALGHPLLPGFTYAWRSLVPGLGKAAGKESGGLWASHSLLLHCSSLSLGTSSSVRVVEMLSLQLTLSIQSPT